MQEIHGIANVLYATVGEKRIAMKRTGEPAIVAYVLDKGNFRRTNRVPKSIRIAMPESAKSRLIKSDVVELPSAPEAFGVRTGHVIQASMAILAFADLSSGMGGGLTF